MARSTQLLLRVSNHNLQNPNIVLGGIFRVEQATSNRVESSYSIKDRNSCAAISLSNNAG